MGLYGVVALAVKPKSLNLLWPAAVRIAGDLVPSAPTSGLASGNQVAAWIKAVAGSRGSAATEVVTVVAGFSSMRLVGRR